MNSLRVRLFLMVSLVVVVAVGTVYVLANQGTERAVVGLAAGSVQRDQRLAISLLEDSSPTGDVRVMQAEAERLSQAMGAQIVVANPDGTVLVDSANRLVGQSVPLAGQPVVGFAAAPFVVENQPAYVMVSYAPAFGLAAGLPTTLVAGQFFTQSVAAPPDILFSAPSPVQIAHDSINRSLLLAAAAGGGVALALTWLFSRRIVAPVEALTAAARRLEKGDLSQRVTARAQDEIGALGRAFNAMADGLSRTEQLRQQMVGDIAHELRTPLTNLRGYLEAVRDGVVAVSPEVVQSLFDEAMLLNRLVDDLQELTLAEAGQLRLNLAPVSVAEAAARMVATLPPQLLAEAPAIRLEAPDDLPPVLADPERLRQILRNLVSNAVQHTPPEGEVVVSARRLEDRVAVSVRDTGQGIAPEHLPFVFERFYRADPSRARATGGAGLGLAIVKKLVEVQGGEISVESSPGAGATFTFSLPAVGEPEAAA